MNTRPKVIGERERLLRKMASDFGMSYWEVLEISEALGSNEDNDALIISLEDYVDQYEEMFDEWEFDDD